MFLLQELRRLTGNMFVCNLAVADLIVTALLLPLTGLNLLNGNENVLTIEECYIIGFLLPLSCNASICNLTFISVQRYVRSLSYLSRIAPHCTKNKQVYSLRENAECKSSMCANVV